MANEYDGRIVISARINTPEMEEDTNACNELLKSIVQTAQGVREKLRGVFSGTVAPASEKALEGALPGREDLGRLDEVREKMEAINAQGQTTQTPNLDKLRAEKGALTETSEAAQVLVEEIDRMNRASEQGFKNPEQVLRFGDNFARVEQAIAAARAELDALADTLIPTKEFTDVQAQADKVNERIGLLNEKMQKMREAGVDEQSDRWQNVADQLEIAEQSAAKLLARKQELEASGEAYLDKSQATEYNELAGAIKEAERRLEINKELINQEAIEQARLNVLAAQERVAVAQTGAERERAMQELQAAQQQLTEAAAQSVTPKPDSDALSGWDALKAKVGDTKNVILQAFGTGAGNLFDGLKNGLKKAGSWFKGLLSNAKDATLSTKGLVKGLTSIKTMLISRVKSTFVSFLSSAISDGIKGLARYSSAVDGAISRLRNSTKEIGANLAVTLGSILTAIEPIITTVLNAVSAAVTKVNALIAMLRGQKTMTVAKKQTESYAASLDGTASKTKKAAAAQKKYNAQLMGFDQLNKLSAPNETDKDTGSDMFATVPTTQELKKVPDELEDLVKRIKDAVKAGDWRGVGRALGDGMNMAVNAFDGFINKIRPKATAAARALGEGITGFLEAADTSKAGATLANGLNLITQTIHSFITSVKWDLAGVRLAEGINGLFHGINWEEVAYTLADGFNGLVDFLFNAITNIEWAGIASDMSAGVNKLVERVDWKKAGATLGEAVKGLLRFIVTALEEIDWKAVGAAIWDFVAGIDWGGIVSLIFEGLGAALIGLGELILGFGEKLLGAIYDAIIEKGKELGWDIEGENIVLGILEGILAALVGIGEWIIDNIFKPIWNGIKSAFGIASPSKETKTLGGYIIDGLLEGILGGLGAILDFFSDLVDKIGEVLSGAWEGIKSAASTAWDAIGGVLSGAWNGIKSAASTAWNGAKGLVSTVSDGIQSVQLKITNSKLYQAGADAMESLRSKCSEKWEDVKNTIGDAWDGLRGFLSKKDGLVQAGKDLLEGLKGGIQKGWAAVKETVGGVWDKVVSGAKSAFGVQSPSKVFRAIGENLDEGLVLGINDEKSTVLSTTAQLAKETTDRMQAGLKAPTLDAPKIKTPDVEIPDIKAPDVELPDIHATVVPDIQTAGIEDVTSSIQARLHGMAGMFDGLVERLAAIADAFAGVQFSIPDIATGAVIPPRLRTTEPLNAQPTAAVAAEGQLERKLDTLIALLTDQQAKGREISITVPLQLDRNELGRAVARYNTSGQRITNGGLR